MTAPLTGIQRVRLDALVEQLDERRSHTKAADLHQALDLLDAQGPIVARLRDGWRPSCIDPGNWVKAGQCMEPMTPAELVVLYGDAP